jgi:hypothetical protein
MQIAIKSVQYIAYKYFLQYTSLSYEKMQLFRTVFMYNTQLFGRFNNT